MTITFVSNYINHHQIPLSNALFKELGDNYCFIQTEPMEADRVAMGWESECGELPYLRTFGDNSEKCRQLILESDIVIFGGVEEEAYIQPRLAAGKIVLRYAERLYRNGVWRAISPRGLWKKYQDHTKYRKKPVYLLCSGGYVPYDYGIVKAYPNKMFRFGYFPKFYEYDVTTLIEEKPNDVVELLWAGRFLPLKHPELVIEAGKYLREKEIPFHINIIGGGELEEYLKQSIAKENLTQYVTLCGYKNPKEVREYMKQANVFLFTSDFREGWGAVLNESMNAGCAVVVNHGIGAVPFLVQHGTNGVVYKNGNVEEFLQNVGDLVENKSLRETLGRAAYETIATEWNEKEAVKRLLHLCDKLQECDILYEKSGPLSKAPVVKERKMYEYLTGKKGVH